MDEGKKTLSTGRFCDKKNENKILVTYAALKQRKLQKDTAWMPIP